MCTDPPSDAFALNLDGTTAVFVHELWSMAPQSLMLPALPLLPFQFTNNSRELISPTVDVTFQRSWV